MNKKELYAQCSLQRDNVSTVSYIPAKFAKVGKILKLLEGGVWTNGWKVTGVGNTTDSPPDAYSSAKEHRRRTGDSLPKTRYKDELPGYESD